MLHVKNVDAVLSPSVGIGLGWFYYGKKLICWFYKVAI